MCSTNVDRSERLPWLWLAALAGMQLLLDLALAPRVMGEGDAAEFTLVLAVAGVPHPPGYPLYTLFGHAFVCALHALGVGWPFAASLWSVAGAAAATLLTAALADHMIPVGTRLALPARLAVVAAALLALAANPVFLRAATQAEVYSWQTAWVAGSALAALTLWRMLARLEPVRAQHGEAFALGWGALTGAGLAHHLTSIFFAVPLGLLLALAALRARRLSMRVVFAFMVGLVLILLSYGLVAWRAFRPAAFQWPALEPTASSVLMHVSGAVYRTFVGGFHPGEADRKLLLSCVMPVAVLGSAFSVAAAWRARHDTDAAPLLALLAAVVLQVAFTLSYGIVDPSPYFLPVMVVGVVAAARLMAEFAARLTHPLMAGGLALAAMMIVALAWVAPEFGHSRRIAEVDGNLREAFRALPFGRGIVIWDSDSYVRLRAYQLLDGDQPGLVVVNPAMLTWPAERRAKARALGFDPLAGLRLDSDADLATVARNIARQTRLPVVDFASWWARSRGLGPAEPAR